MNMIQQDSSNNNSSILIKAKTWNRDSHGLYDYENTNVKQSVLGVNSSGIIIRKKNDLKFFYTKWW